jgi:hypothetical protein
VSFTLPTDMLPETNADLQCWRLTAAGWNLSKTLSFDETHRLPNVRDTTVSLSTPGSWRLRAIVTSRTTVPVHYSPWSYAQIPSPLPPKLSAPRLPAKVVVPPVVGALRLTLHGRVAENVPFRVSFTLPTDMLPETNADLQCWLLTAAGWNLSKTLSFSEPHRLTNVRDTTVSLYTPGSWRLRAMVTSSTPVPVHYSPWSYAQIPSPPPPKLSAPRLPAKVVVGQQIVFSGWSHPVYPSTDRRVVVAWERLVDGHWVAASQTACTVLLTYGGFAYSASVSLRQPGLWRGRAILYAAGGYRTSTSSWSRVRVTADGASAAGTHPVTGATDTHRGQ